MDDVYLRDVLKWKGDAFRRSDPLHHPILAHEGGHYGRVPGNGATLSSSMSWALLVTRPGVALTPGTLIHPLPKSLFPKPRLLITNWKTC
jgi:hypothetical protein